MKWLQLWRVKFNRICRATKQKYHTKPECLQIILGKNGSPLRAIFAAVEIIKEGNTAWHNDDFVFELPDRDASTGVYLCSSIEEDLPNQATGINPPSILAASAGSPPARFFYKDKDGEVKTVPEGTFVEYNMVKPAHPCKEANHVPVVEKPV